MSPLRKILPLLVLALAGCYGTTYGYTAENGVPDDIGPYGYYYGGWAGARPWNPKHQVRRAERHERHEARVARRHL